MGKDPYERLREIEEDAAEVIDILLEHKAMEAANAMRRDRGASLAYGEEAYEAWRDRLGRLRQRIRDRRGD